MPELCDRPEKNLKRYRFPVSLMVRFYLKTRIPEYQSGRKKLIPIGIVHPDIGQQSE